MDQRLLCTECGEQEGEIFLCGEGYFCPVCYDKLNQ